MLICKDMVVAKNEKGEVVGTRVYDRVYLSHAEGDEVETVDVTSNGKVVGQKTRPKGDSKADLNTLFAAAVEFIQTQKPKSNPLRVILESTQYGLDLGARAEIRQELIPAKAPDADKTVEQMAKKLFALQPEKYGSLDAAKAQIRAMLG